MTKARAIYTKEFKLAILSQVKSGIPIARVARENGLHPALANIGAFIEDVYNSKRMHSALGYLSPIEFEQKLKEKQQEELYIVA